MAFASARSRGNRSGSSVQVGQAVVRAAAAKGRALRNPHAYGVLEAQAPGRRAFRLDVSLDFPQVPCLSIKSPCTGAGLGSHLAQLQVAVVVSPVALCCINHFPDSKDLWFISIVDRLTM